MWEGGITSELFQRLVSQGDISRPAGTGGLDRKTGGAQSSAQPRGAAAKPGEYGQEERSGLILAWVNPAMTKRTRRSSARLVIVG